MQLEHIKTPVSSLPGAGPAAVKQLAALNIFTISDLLSFYPRGYKDHSHRVPISEYASNKEVHTIAQVLAHEWFGYGKMKTLKIIISDNTARAELIAFNRPFLEKSLPVGSIISVTGPFQVKYGTLQCTSFESEKIADGGSLDDYADTTIPGSGVLPVYPLTKGLTQKKLSRIVQSAVNQYLHGIDEVLPDDIIQKRSLLPFQDALYKIHCPSSVKDAEDARRTIIYKELFQFQTAMAKRALLHKGELPQINFDSESIPQTGTSSKSDTASGTGPDALDFSPKQAALLERLPFALTKDQMSVIMEMNRDIDRGFSERSRILKLVENSNKNSENPQALLSKQPYTMQRLLQGDVGSGKTLAAIFACLRVTDWGGQCAIMAPTEILARQHAETTAKLLEPLGVRTAFLSGNLKAQGRTLLLKALKAGEIDILIGTHALFSKSTEYNDLQLAVIDEQHRFGVMQRQSIIEKGRAIITPGSDIHSALYAAPHLLMMSATPIPQTMALTVFGDLDVSTIRTMPQGRKPVITYLSQEGHEENVYNAVRKELQKGRQAYFVYPAIEDNPDAPDGKELKSATDAFKKLSKVFSEYKCALIHSKISEDEQTKILNQFRDGKIQILAATTVVEVGVDVPNATCMAIEQADRFGLSQLHQLRGRVGRGSEQSYCFLVYRKNLTETGKERMRIIRQNTDGFVIAEEDLKLRGPGELTGTAQAGELNLGLADFSRDRKLLLEAREDAFKKLRQ